MPVHLGGAGVGDGVWMGLGLGWGERLFPLPDQVGRRTGRLEYFSIHWRGPTSRDLTTRKPRLLKRLREPFPSRPEGNMSVATLSHEPPRRTREQEAVSGAALPSDGAPT